MTDGSGWEYAVITLLAVTGLTHRQSYGDIFAITCIKTLTVFRSILKRAERDEEIDRNPIPLVAKPRQLRTRFKS